MQFCAISSREFLPFARVLAASIHRYQPDAELFTLLVDDVDHEVDDASEPFHCVRNDDIGLDQAELHRMYLIHGGLILPAIKPFFIEHVLNLGATPTLYIDSDICLYGSLADVGELIEEHGVVVSPHAMSPYPLDGLMPDDTTILSAGTFNAGLIGVGERGRGLLEFLMSRLRRECIVDPPLMRVNEQRWLDYVPSFFSCHVLRDSGINAAYWNLHERPLSVIDDQIYVGERPLRAYHFSGLDPKVPEQLSRHCAVNPRISLEDQPILKSLVEEYVAALVENSFGSYQATPMPFDTLPGGIPIDPVLRAAYRAAVIEAENHSAPLPPDGFDLAERSNFLAWVAAFYPRAHLEFPSWLNGAATSDPARLPPPSAVPAPQASTGESVSSNAEELVRNLAQASAAALANLDRRVADLERNVAELAPARVAS